MKRLKYLLLCILATIVIGVVLILPISLITYSWILYVCSTLDLQIAIIVTIINVLPLSMWLVLLYGSGK
jgi:hypothetical protein